MIEQITGNLVDIAARQIYPATVYVKNGRITKIDAHPGTPAPGDRYLLPGFIDAHVHVESSMLVPSEFARLAVTHGTIGTVSDPHEIANVCGIAGVEYMLANGNSVPFYFNFGAPSCVPATTFETAGATLNAAAVEELLARKDIRYLSEMMNFPGVLNGDAEVMDKISAAHAQGKPVDGHAPGLMGNEAKQYIDAGISTDHECFTYDEALNKLNLGMKILIREGSAAKNFEALVPLLHDHSDKMMFCSDDKHPDSLAAGHIDRLCARAVERGIDVFNVLQAACINPVIHYNLQSGLLRMGDAADLIVVKDLKTFAVLETYIRGELVAKDGKTLIPSITAELINNFSCTPKSTNDFAYPCDKWGDEENFEQVHVIEAFDGQLITGKHTEPISSFDSSDGFLHSSVERDILKLVVVNRYNDAPIAKAFIKNFGIQHGAIASSVAHDSHNIIAVGVDDESLCKAVNLVISERGGISCVAGSDNKNGEKILALPVAGLMSNIDGYDVARAYTEIDAMAKETGSTLAAPFMTLSFMALLVIPHLKLSDLGLFDADAFKLL